MADNCRKHKINDVNHYNHRTPDTDCACAGEGGSERGQGRGPATDPALTAKSQPPLLHPQTPEAEGPAKEGKGQ